MNQQFFFTIPIDELEQNVKCWLREVLVENNNKEDKNLGIAELLTCKQTAKLLNVSLATLHNWHRQGKITPKRIGRRVLYDKQQLFSALKEIDRLKYKSKNIQK